MEAIREIQKDGGSLVYALVPNTSDQDSHNAILVEMSSEFGR
jgi:hypothetical protein